jgi:hypothetical protein
MSKTNEVPVKVRILYKLGICNRRYQLTTTINLEPYGNKKDHYTMGSKKWEECEELIRKKHDKNNTVLNGKTYRVVPKIQKVLWKF